MVHWSPFVMSFKKKYPWIQLAGHAGSAALSDFLSGTSGSLGSHLAPMGGRAWPWMLLGMTAVGQFSLRTGHGGCSHTGHTGP